VIAGKKGRLLGKLHVHYGLAKEGLENELVEGMNDLECILGVVF
jgi:hypothetical protein